MAYKGVKLADWFNDAPVGKHLRALADDVGARQTTLTKELTPVDTGHLRESEQQTETVVEPWEGTVRYVTGVHTYVEYAPDVEFGTGLWGPEHSEYIIRPRKPGGVLRFFNDQGEIVFTREVHHPGSPGAHMFARAVALTEAEFSALAEPHGERLMHELEHQIRFSRVHYGRRV